MRWWSGEFVCICVKRWLDAGKQLDLCKCCACQMISRASTWNADWVKVNSWTSANAVPVSGFRVHLHETLAGCR